jgi:hypothetical protein
MDVQVLATLQLFCVIYLYVKFQEKTPFAKNLQLKSVPIKATLLTYGAQAKQHLVF